MIKSFRDKDTEKLFHGLRSRLPPDIAATALRKLAQIHAAEVLGDLAIFPGNRLEALKGDRAGRHSVRINEQWRVCFLWEDGHAYEVQIVDYH
jgi:proteic killer suppression protein